MDDEKVFPPVTVYDTDCALSLVDGFHRIAALTRLGKEEVEANVIKGTYPEALKASLSMNDKHGLRRTNADKRRCLEIALENKDILFDSLDGTDDKGKPTGLPSKRQLADVTGVSDFTACIFLQECRVVDSTTSQKDATTPTKDHLEERNEDVRKLLAQHKDRNGVDIPDYIYSSLTSTAPKQIARHIRACMSIVKRETASGSVLGRMWGSRNLETLSRALTNNKFYATHCVCPYCHGKVGGCDKCGWMGAMSLAQYKLLPSEMKAAKDR